MGKRMYERLKRLGITQADVTQEMGVGQKNFHNWATGETEIGGANLVALARALQVSVEYLWSGETLEEESQRLRVFNAFLDSEDAKKPVIDDADRLTLEAVVFHGREPSVELYKQWYFALRTATKLT